jgi:hypothetical protein
MKFKILSLVALNILTKSSYLISSSWRVCSTFSNRSYLTLAFLLLWATVPIKYSIREVKGRFYPLIIYDKALLTLAVTAVLVSLYFSAKSVMNCLSFYALIFLPSRMERYSTVLIASMKTKAFESSSIWTITL